MCSNQSRYRSLLLNLKLATKETAATSLWNDFYHAALTFDQDADDAMVSKFTPDAVMGYLKKYHGDQSNDLGRCGVVFAFREILSVRTNLWFIMTTQAVVVWDSETEPPPGWKREQGNCRAAGEIVYLEPADQVESSCKQMCANIAACVHVSFKKSNGACATYNENECVFDSNSDETTFDETYKKILTHGACLTPGDEQQQWQAWSNALGNRGKCESEGVLWEKCCWRKHIQQFDIVAERYHDDLRGYHDMLTAAGLSDILDIDIMKSLDYDDRCNGLLYDEEGDVHLFTKISTSNNVKFGTHNEERCSPQQVLQEECTSDAQVVTGRNTDFHWYDPVATGPTSSFPSLPLPLTQTRTPTCTYQTVDHLDSFRRLKVGIAPNRQECVRMVLERSRGATGVTYPAENEYYNVTTRQMQLLSEPVSFVNQNTDLERTYQFGHGDADALVEHINNGGSYSIGSDLTLKMKLEDSHHASFVEYVKINLDWTDGPTTIQASDGATWFSVPAGTSGSSLTPGPICGVEVQTKNNLGEGGSNTCLKVAFEVDGSRVSSVSATRSGWGPLTLNPGGGYDANYSYHPKGQHDFFSWDCQQGTGLKIRFANCDGGCYTHWPMIEVKLRQDDPMPSTLSVPASGKRRGVLEWDVCELRDA